MLEFKEGRYYLGLWFFTLPVELTNFGKGGDFMACVWREQDSDDWVMDYRFRHCKDDKIWNTDDQTSWYQATMRSTEEAIEKRVNEFVAAAAKAAKPDTETSFFAIKGDLSVFVTKLEGDRPPWLHVRIEIEPLA
jgi:hypothetical protein